MKPETKTRARELAARIFHGLICMIAGFKIAEWIKEWIK